MNEVQSTPPLIKLPNSTNKNKKKKLALLLIVLMIIFVGTAAYLATSKEAPIITSQMVESREVQISSDGFEPATILIKSGTQVVWTNIDSSLHQISADPYPTGASLPELDSREALSKDESFGFIFNEKGTFTYHDRLNPTKFVGTVIVE